MTGNNSSMISSLFAFPKLCVGFSTKVFSDSEAFMSPTSIIEAKSFSFFNRLLERNYRKPHCGNGDLKAIGLGLINDLIKEGVEKRGLNQGSRLIISASQLKIQIPHMKSNLRYSTGSAESPRSPIEFGIKNKNSQLALHSHTVLHCETSPSSPIPFAGLSPSEMELSEEYTCVISYGPNPKKTHIFDNRIVESCDDGFMALLNDQKSGRHSEHYLSSCHACRKKLDRGGDIFIYRGERGFCSPECRQLEMMSDNEGTQNSFLNLLDSF